MNIFYKKMSIVVTTLFVSLVFLLYSKMALLLSMISTVFTFALLDSIWIYSNRNMYKNLSLDVSGHKTMTNPYGLFGALLSYLLMVLVIMFVGRPLVLCSSMSIFKASMLYGGLIGLYGYGIFNGTNLVLFKNYDPKVAIIDTLWGTFLMALTTYIATKVYTYYQ